MVVRIRHLVALVETGKIEDFLNKLEELLDEYAEEDWYYQYNIDDIDAE